MRPLMGFNQVGIEVYFGGNAATVGEAVTALAQGKLPPVHHGTTPAAAGEPINQGNRGPAGLT